MNWYDAIAGVLLGTGFWNGTKRPLAQELYKLLTAVTVLGGSFGLYGLTSKVIGWIPGFEPERRGLWGFLATVVIAFFGVRVGLKRVREAIREKYADRKAGAIGGVLGVLRSGALVGGGTGALLLSGLFSTVEQSAVGQLVGMLLGR